MIELDLAETKELLAAAVAERGEDYVYANPGGTGNEGINCLYVHIVDGEKTCGCIVAWVLHQAGVPLASLAGREGDNATAVMDALSQINVIEVDLDATELLQDVQERQDRGIPWGQAVREALAETAG